MIVSIEKRLGFLIGFKRREKLSEGDLAYKQENFILCDDKHPFDGCIHGTQVCSLATLSRLENGKHDNNHALLDFFLKKLGYNYRIRESVYEQENEYLNRIAFGFSSSPKELFKTDQDALTSFFNRYHEDLLISYDIVIDRFINRVMLNQSVSRQDYEAMMKIRGIVHPLISNWLHECGLLLKQIHPDFWDIKVEANDFVFSKAVKIIKNLRKIRNLDHELVIMSFYQRFHPQSMAISFLDTLIRNVHGEIGKTPEEALTESELCLLIIKGIPIKRVGKSALYNALLIYEDIKDGRDKLDYLSNDIIPILSKEPTPKLISIALSEDVLNLCQNLKTYKPLVAFVTLLSENEG